MGKKTIIAAGIVILGAAAAGAHIAAPSYFENRFRAYLTHPGSDLRGQFDDFHMSLFGGTMSASNVKLAHRDGAIFEANAVHLDQVNWLTLVGVNPFGTGLAETIDVTKAMLQVADMTVTAPAPVFGDVGIYRNGNDIAFSAATAELTELSFADAQNRASEADLVTAENLSFDRMGSIAVQNWRYHDPVAGYDGLTETVTFSGCDGPTVFLRGIAPDLDQGFDICDDVSGTGVTLHEANGLSVKLASFAFSELQTRGAQSASITGMELGAKNDDTVVEIGEIAIRDFQHSLSADAFDDLGDLSDQEWQTLLDGLSIGEFSITDQSVRDHRLDLSVGRFVLSGLSDGKLSGVQIADIAIKPLDRTQAAEISLAELAITNVNLRLLTDMIKRFDFADIPNADPARQMEVMENYTLGQLNLPISQILYEDVSLSGLSMSSQAPDGTNIAFSIDKLGAHLAAPFRPEGMDESYAKSNLASIDGLTFEFTGEDPRRQALAAALGMEDITEISLALSSAVVWDEDSGVYTYDIEKIALRNFGQISLKASLAGFSNDIMTRLLNTKLGDDATLQQTLLVQSKFNGARLEISGDKLVPLILNLISMANDIPPEQLQLMAAGILMQTQQAVAQNPRLAASIGELITWIEDPKHLLITLEPADPVPIGILASGAIPPPQMADMLGLTILANDNIQ